MLSRRDNHYTTEPVSLRMCSVNLNPMRYCANVSNVCQIRYHRLSSRVSYCYTHNVPVYTAIGRVSLLFIVCCAIVNDRTCSNVQEREMHVQTYLCTYNSTIMPTSLFKQGFVLMKFCTKECIAIDPKLSKSRNRNSNKMKMKQICR